MAPPLGGFSLHNPTDRGGVSFLGGSFTPSTKPRFAAVRNSDEEEAENEQAENDEEKAKNIEEGVQKGPQEGPYCSLAHTSKCDISLRSELSI
jgi:hypothetical protein